MSQPADADVVGDGTIQVLAATASSLVTARPSGLFTPAVAAPIGLLVPGVTGAPSFRIWPVLPASVWDTNAYGTPSCCPTLSFCKPVPRLLAKFGNWDGMGPVDVVVKS